MMEEKSIELKIKQEDNNKLGKYIKYVNINILYYDNYCIRIYIKDAMEFIKFLKKHNINAILLHIGSIFNDLIKNNCIDLLDNLINIYQNNNSFFDKASDPSNYSLNIACINANLNTIIYLLKNMDYTRGNKIHAFYLACKRGDIEIVNILLNELDMSPLAGLTWSREIGDFLDPRSLSHWNCYFSLLCSIKSDNWRIVELLLNHARNSNFDLNANNFLVEAIKYNSVDIVDLLIKKGADPNIIQINYIIDYMKLNNLDMMECLINKFNQTRIDKFFIDSSECSIEMVELLINANANVKQYGKKLCLSAKESNNNNLAEYLKRVIKIE